MTPTSRDDLVGLNAVVTGAAGGIGREVSRLLRERGANVLGLDLRSSEDVIQADVASASDCRRIASLVDGTWPAVHILVNNAGIAAFDMSILQATEEDWDRAMSVNAKSVFLLTKALLPPLTRAKGACVVNVSSVHALATAAGVAPYAASKGATLALTRSMAIDLAASRVRAVAILPGATSTNMLEEYAARSGKTLEELGFDYRPDAIGRVCDPAEVAEAIVFAASPAGSGINGSAITVDGGLLAGYA